MSRASDSDLHMIKETTITEKTIVDTSSGIDVKKINLELKHMKGIVTKLK